MLNGPQKQNSYLTTQAYWKKSGFDSPPSAKPRSSFQQLFDRYLPKVPDWSVIEIGSCPGNNLVAVALSHGYRPVALDILPAVFQIGQSFGKLGIKGFSAYQEDFLQWKPPNTFNVVMSFGFIEHFDKPDEILERHWRCVAPGGYLVVGVPVFGPMQMILRKLILTHSKLREVLTTHNLAIMDLTALKASCMRLGACNVIHSSYIWEMQTWFSEKDPFVLPNMAWALKIWRAVGRIPQKLRWSSRLFSPYCVVIVRKDPIRGLISDEPFAMEGNNAR